MLHENCGYVATRRIDIGLSVSDDNGSIEKFASPASSVAGERLASFPPICTPGTTSSDKTPRAVATTCSKQSFVDTDNGSEARVCGGSSLFEKSKEKAITAFPGASIPGCFGYYEISFPASVPARVSDGSRAMLALSLSASIIHTRHSFMTSVIWCSECRKETFSKQPVWPDLLCYLEAGHGLRGAQQQASL